MHLSVCLCFNHDDMSKYEDYSKVSKNYDADRKAVGVDIIIGLLRVYVTKPLKVRLNVE